MNRNHGRNDDETTSFSLLTQTRHNSFCHSAASCARALNNALNTFLNTDAKRRFFSSGFFVCAPICHHLRRGHRRHAERGDIAATLHRHPRAGAAQDVLRLVQGPGRLKMCFTHASRTSAFTTPRVQEARRLNNSSSVL